MDLGAVVTSFARAAAAAAAACSVVAVVAKAITRSVHDGGRLRIITRGVEGFRLWQPSHVGDGDTLSPAECREQHDAEAAQRNFLAF